MTVDVPVKYFWNRTALAMELLLFELVKFDIALLANILKNLVLHNLLVLYIYLYIYNLLVLYIYI